MTACRQWFDCETVTGVETVDGAMAFLTGSSPDLVIVDLLLPDGDGIALAKWICQHNARPAILGISGYTDDVTIYRVMLSGLQSFIDKGALSMTTLQTAIAATLAGKHFFSEPILSLQAALRRDPLAFPKLLTSKECCILSWIASGADDQKAADAIAISLSTLRWHRKQIMRKLGIHSAVELAHYASEKGFARWATSDPMT